MLLKNEGLLFCKQEFISYQFLFRSLWSHNILLLGKNISFPTLQQKSEFIESQSLRH